jgi:hypothetical protein
MKKNILVLFMLFFAFSYLISNEVKKIDDQNKNISLISFRLKPSVNYFGSSVEVIDNNETSYGDYVFEQGFWFGTGNSKNNLKEPVLSKINEGDVHKLCNYLYSSLNFGIGTGTAHLLSFLLIPGIILTVNSKFDYLSEHNTLDSLLLFSLGTGFIAGGATAGLLFLVYGIILIVVAAKYFETKKLILKQLNNSNISLENKHMKFSFYFGINSSKQ